MARLMLSAGMFTPLAAAIAVRRRGLPSGSPPPARAATVISLMIVVKALPRLASAAAFLCLIECHLECPDMAPPLVTHASTGGAPAHATAALARGPSVPSMRLDV